MFSKKKARQRNRAENSPPARALQRLAEELEPSAKYRQELEEQLRRFASQPIVTAQPALSAKGFRLKGIIMSSYNQVNSRQLGRRGLLAGLGLVVALAVGLLAWVYLYTPPALPVTARPSVPVATTPGSNSTEEEECRQHNVSGADCVIYLEQQLRQVEWQWPALSQKLNLAQRASGYTLTVQRAYADANNIYIGYQLDGPGAELQIYNLSLVEEGKEQEIVRINSMGRVVHLEKSSMGLIQFTEGLPSSMLNQSEVHLRWKVPGIDVRKADWRNSLPRDGSLANAYSHLTANMVFDLNVPVIAGQQVKLNWQDGGAALQKAIITPSEIRFFLTGIGEVTPVGQLTIDGVAAELSHLSREPDGLATLGFDNILPPDGRSHQFVLKVQPGQLDTWNPFTKFNHMMAGGPWSFQFQLP